MVEDNFEADLEEEKPLKTAIGNTEQIDVYTDRVIIRGRGLSNSLKIRGTFTASQVTSITIKPGGTLYDGNIEIMAAGMLYKIEFKGYMLEDFEQVKALLKK